MVLVLNPHTVIDVFFCTVYSWWSFIYLFYFLLLSFFLSFLSYSHFDVMVVLFSLHFLFYFDLDIVKCI